MSDIMEELGCMVHSFSDGPPFVVAYVRYMTVFRNLTLQTAITGYRTIREFCQYIHYKTRFHSKPTSVDAFRCMSICQMEVYELCTVTEETVMGYLTFLDTVVRNKPDTISRKISDLRSFFQYLIDQQTELGIRLRENPFQDTRIMIRKKPATVMSGSEIHKLIGSIDGDNAIRDKAIIILILSSGLRLEELANLDAADIDGGVLTVRGENTRIMELNDDCVTILQQYLLEYRAPIEETLKDDALFVSQLRAKRLSHRRIQQTIEKRMASAGFTDKGYTAATLRDTAIQMLLNSCEEYEVPAVMEYLGFRKAQSSNRFTTTHRKSVASRMRSMSIMEE